jgi:hypothetical protein
MYFLALNVEIVMVMEVVAGNDNTGENCENMTVIPDNKSLIT